MKNLEVLELQRKHVQNIFGTAKCFSQAVISTYDTINTSKIYFISNNYLYEFDCDNEESDAIPLIDIEFEDVINLKILLIDSQIHVVTSTKLYVINLNNNQESPATLLQEIQFFDILETVEWSPTEEYLAAIASNGNIIVVPLGGYFEASYHSSSNVEDKIPDSVYVGWGSENTQFRGSVGKLKQKLEVEVKPIDYRTPTITWRGNGELFAVNYWKDSQRLFVVFKNTGNALYRSENCPGLQAPIAWRPTGNMIATISDFDGKEVVIFEKNGQKRFSFKIDCDCKEIVEMKWSRCAKILAIHCKNSESLNQSITLWSSTNYQWHQKQHLKFDSINPLLNFVWMPSTFSTYSLRIITKNDILNYKFRHIVNQNNDGAICGVINGKTLQITDFGAAIIPPPLYSQLITSNHSINMVRIRENGDIVLLNSNDCLEVYSAGNYNKVDEVNLIKLFGNVATHIPLKYQHVCWTKNPAQIALVVELNSGCKSVAIVDFSTKTTQILKEFPETVIGLLDFGYNLEGQFYNIHTITEELSYITPTSNQGDSLVEFNTKTIDGVIYACFLTAQGHLITETNETVNTNVNSFHIFDDYLLFTTKLNVLFCCKLNQIGELTRRNNYCSQRQLEQGSIIITGIPETSKIILQLPRGNLEAISCRSIAIDILDRMLDQNRWTEAIFLIKTDKLNSNLLFDLNPIRFLSSIEKFIIASKTCNELNRICLEFEDGNVLNTIYRPGNHSPESPQKTHQIFKKILAFFDEKDYVNYITTIMIINYHFFTLQNSLKYLQDLLRRSQNTPDLEKKLKEAVNTLKIYGADEKLYDTALSLYDLELANYLATCCQMDPRIYEPQLHNLRKLDEIDRRYQINLYLKKPKIAVQYLLRNKNTSPENLESFIQTNNVANEAYENLNCKSVHFQLVSRLYGRDLSRKNHHREAGVVLKKAGLLEEALEEFQLALKWQECVELIDILELHENEKCKILYKLAEDLTQNHQVLEAAHLYDVYIRNYERAIKVLLDSQKFGEALHLAKKYKREDLILSEIRPALENHHQYLKEKLEELHNVFNQHKNRLNEVWVKRIEKKSHYDEGYNDDLFSDAGSIISSRSNTSSRSRSSTASARNRRKEARKKQDLREGGVYEDIAIIRAVYGLIKEIYCKKDDIKECCLLLLQESDMEFKSIKSLIKLYETIESDIKTSVNNIWPPCFSRKSENPEMKEIAVLENFESLDEEFRKPPEVPSDWKLIIFK